jgi:hypothetical protein
MKNDKIANNSTTTTAKEKISVDLEFLEFQNVCDVGLGKFKTNQILLNNISNPSSNDNHVPLTLFSICPVQ